MIYILYIYIGVDQFQISDQISENLSHLISFISILFEFKQSDLKRIPNGKWIPKMESKKVVELAGLSAIRREIANELLKAKNKSTQHRQ